MVSGIGLGKFNPIEMKETSRSPKPSSFDSAPSKEDSISSHRSSVSQNKTLEKITHPKEKFKQKTSDHESEFNKKVESYSKDDEKSASVDSSKLDKKDAKEAQKEIQKDNNHEIPQMLMLQGVQPVFVNQQAVTEAKAQSDVDLNLKVSSQAQPVLKFMKAMQENFGISPQQIMKALGEMPQQMLMKSPHEAMTPLFEKLGIQPRQFTKAQILYTEMLTDMEKVEPQSFQGKLPIASSGALGAMSITPAPKSTLEQLMEQKISRRALEPTNFKDAIKAPQHQESMAQIFKIDPTVVNPNGINPNAVNLDAVNPNVVNPNAVNPAEGLALDKLQEFDPQLRIEDVKINPNKVTEQFSSSAPILGGGAAVSALASAEGKKAKDNSQDDLKDNFAEQMMQMPTDKKIDGQFAVDKLGAAAAAPGAQHQNQLSNENVEKLISGSQALLKKGGGEMKIQLNPEGLGKIHLNIKVEDGKVGVQMMADTQEAKKLLETSMNDLKLGLAEHKLNLNHAKVDVSEQSSQNMNQSHDFKREQARDFLGQFRQFNESFRQGANDLSGVRAYRKSTQAPTPDIQPLESRRSDSGKSGGLYLVA